jgi:hypothetical protein
LLRKTDSYTTRPASVPPGSAAEPHTWEVIPD